MSSDDVSHEDEDDVSHEDEEVQALGDVFFELPLKKWGMFESTSLLGSKIVLLSDLPGQSGERIIV